MHAFPDLSRRRRQPEIMDQPGLEVGAHVAALAALERINFWSGSARLLWRELCRLGPAPLRVLDIATGGGDVPIRLAQQARRAGVALQLAGCDRSATAIAHAKQQAAQRQCNVDFFSLDVLGEALPADYDVLMCSLFLHHLDEEPAIDLLRRMGQTARRLVLISDLERSRIGWLLAWLGTRLLSSSRVAWVDGPLSVEGAFTAQEARHLAECAGLEGAILRRCWPCRFLLAWHRPAGPPH